MPGTGRTSLLNTPYRGADNEAEMVLRGYLNAGRSGRLGRRIPNLAQSSEGGSTPGGATYFSHVT